MNRWQSLNATWRKVIKLRREGETCFLLSTFTADFYIGLNVIPFDVTWYNVATKIVGKKPIALLYVKLFLNGPTPASFSFIFGLFKQTIQFLQQINVKNVMSIHYTAQGFEPRTFGIESLPVTTRPGLSPFWLQKIPQDFRAVIGAFFWELN